MSLHAPTIAAIFWIAIGVAGPVSPAVAQWRLQIEGGASILTDNLDLGADREQRNDNDEGGLFAVLGGYRIADFVEVTAAVRGGFTPLDVGFLDSLDLVTLTAGTRLYPLGERRLRPYLGAEIGWYHAEVEIERFFSSDDFDEEDDSFGVNAGGGIEFQINRLLSLGADIRYHNASDAFDGIELVSFLATVGFHFGGETPEAR